MAAAVSVRGVTVTSCDRRRRWRRFSNIPVPTASLSTLGTSNTGSASGGNGGNGVSTTEGGGGATHDRPVGPVAAGRTAEPVSRTAEPAAASSSDSHPYPRLSSPPWKRLYFAPDDQRMVAQRQARRCWAAPVMWLVWSSPIPKWLHVGPSISFANGGGSALSFVAHRAGGVVSGTWVAAAVLVAGGGAELDLWSRGDGGGGGGAIAIRAPPWAAAVAGAFGGGRWRRWFFEPNQCPR